MSGFFGITEDDLKDGKASFNAGDVAEMIISSVVRKNIKGNDTIIFECIVTQGGSNVGLKYSEFFRIGSTGGKKALAIFLTSFLSAQEAAQMQDPNVLINRKFTCAFVADGQYVNMRQVKAVNDVPQGLPAQQGIASTAPAAQTAAISPEPQANLNKSLF